MGCPICKNASKLEIKRKEAIISIVPKDKINAKNFNKDETSVSKDNNGDNILKIELFPENKPINTLEKKNIQFLIKNALGHSLDPNKELAFLLSKVPILNGFYTAYINHYPIRIKPDDIWLLIVQAFSHHVDDNSRILRKYFVNFDGNKTLEITILDYFIKKQ